MKLCFLANANSIHSKKWIEYFSRAEHEVHWISLSPNIFEERKGVKLYLFNHFSFKPLDILFNIIQVRKLIKKIKPDILHAHYAGVNGILAGLIGFHPFVLTAWGSDILINTKSKIIKPLIKLVFKKADLITCDADHMKEAMIKLEANPSKIKIIRFGIDTKKFSPGPRNKKIIKELNVNNDPLVISSRSLVPIYDIETLIKSIPIVLQEIPEVKFIIIGNGPEEEKLKILSRNLKIEKNIRFLGFVHNDDLPDYLRSVHTYVSTALSDAGIAAATAEAMSCGLPVVITNTGENEKWVEDGKSGYLIPTGDSQILAEKIIFLIKNENQRIIFGKRARKIIEEENNYFKEMEKMEKIYQNLIKNGKQ